MVNVAKYTSPMDPMGFGEGLRGVPFSSWWFQRFNPFETYATVKFWIISLQAVGEHKKKYLKQPSSFYFQNPWKIVEGLKHDLPISGISQTI